MSEPSSEDDVVLSHMNATLNSSDDDSGDEIAVRANKRRTAILSDDSDDDENVSNSLFTNSESVLTAKQVTESYPL